jgi:putative nucleotidyltransferase with HDIG domain
MAKHGLPDQFETNSYVPLADSDMFDADLATEVYVLNGDRFVLYCDSANSQLFRTQWNEFLQTWRGRVYVRNQHPVVELSDLMENVVRVVADEQINEEDKLHCIYTSVTEMLCQSYAADFPEKVDVVTRIVAATAPFVVKNPLAVTNLGRLLAHDYTTFNHSAGVYVYSVALAGWLGISNEQDLLDLGLAALLHDIGKLRIDPAILLKPGPLTHRERVEMMRHPALGVEMLSDAVELSDNVREMILQHHERIDGSGYPFRLTENALNRLVHIISVADVFDALTKDRPYQAAYSTYRALEIMRNQRIGKIRPAEFRALVLMLAGRPDTIDQDMAS